MFVLHSIDFKIFSSSLFCVNKEYEEFKILYLQHINGFFFLCVCVLLFFFKYLESVYVVMKITQLIMDQRSNQGSEISITIAFVNILSYAFSIFIYIIVMDLTFKSNGLSCYTSLSNRSQVISVVMTE